jgi:hypothetical protein
MLVSPSSARSIKALFVYNRLQGSLFLMNREVIEISLCVPLST